MEESRIEGMARRKRLQTAMGRPGAELVRALSELREVTEYRKLVAARPKLSEFFRESPLTGVGLDLERDQNTGRDEIDL